MNYFNNIFYYIFNNYNMAILNKLHEQNEYNYNYNHYQGLKIFKKIFRSIINIFQFTFNTYNSHNRSY